MPDQYDPQDWDRYAYVLNTPTRYTDPSGHLSCDNSNVAEGDCSNWIYPEKIERWEEIKDKPEELLARSMLSEEGVKIGTSMEDGVVGVGWAIKNRYLSIYADNGEDAWLNAAVSGVFGMRTDFAHDPMNNYRRYFSSRYQAFVSYNKAREHAQNIIAAQQPDITRGAVRWSDGYCTNGTCIDSNRDGFFDNVIPYKRTHFDNDFNSWNLPQVYCVSTVAYGQCR